MACECNHDRTGQSGQPLTGRAQKCDARTTSCDDIENPPVRLLGQSQPIGAATPDAVTGINSQHPKRATPAARSIPMRSIFAIAGLLLCALSFAQGIPSAASGVYLTPDRVCRVVLARYQVSWLRADLTCLEFNGALSNAATVLYAPGEGSCWPDGAAIPFSPQSPVDYVTFSSFTGAVISALVGNQAAVINGGGVEQIWQRIAIVPSPAPYTCASGIVAPDPHYARLCRQFGLYCGG